MGLRELISLNRWYLLKHQQIGQATRIALQQGMNREFEPGILSEEENRHRMKLWWTVYMIDRKLTYLMGVPLTLHDVDITVPKPELRGSSSETDSAFAIHLHLSIQLGSILRSKQSLLSDTELKLILAVIYGLQGRLGEKFIGGVQSILQNLADISTELNQNFTMDSLYTTGTVTRIGASLHILYHQVCALTPFIYCVLTYLKCIILAIRPVLLCLLENKLKSSTASPVSDAVVALLRVCVESSVQVLQIVQALKNQTIVGKKIHLSERRYIHLLTNQISSYPTTWMLCFQRRLPSF